MVGDLWINLKCVNSSSGTGLDLDSAEVGDYLSIDMRILYKKEDLLRTESGYLGGSVKPSGWNLEDDTITYPKIYISNSSFKVYDPAILEERLILEDIDGYRYLDSEYMPQYVYGDGMEAAYYAVYEKGHNFSAVVYEFSTPENCSQFLDSLFTSPYQDLDISEKVFNGMTVYKVILRQGVYNSTTGYSDYVNVTLYIWKI